MTKEVRNLIEANEVLLAIQENMEVDVDFFMDLFNITVKDYDPDLIITYAFRFYEYIKEHKEDIFCWIIEEYCTIPFINFIKDKHIIDESLASLIRKFVKFMLTPNDKLDDKGCKIKRECIDALVDMLDEVKICSKEETLIILLRRVL